MSRASALAARWRFAWHAALGRFPWVVLCGALGTASAITAVHEAQNDALVGQAIRALMVFALGMPLFFSLRMLRERVAVLTGWPIELLGLPFLAASFLLLPAEPFDAPALILIRWTLVLAALHFCAAVSPYVATAERGGFWQFNRRIFLRFCSRRSTAESSRPVLSSRS